MIEIFEELVIRIRIVQSKFLIKTLDLEAAAS